MKFFSVRQLNVSDIQSFFLVTDQALFKGVLMSRNSTQITLKTPVKAFSVTDKDMTVS